MQADRKRARKYLRVGAVADRYGVSVSTIWRWANEARFAFLGFPKPTPIGPHTRGWDEGELDIYDAQRAAMRDAATAA